MHIAEEQDPSRLVINEEFLEQLRNDPDLIVHYHQTAGPSVPQIRLTVPVDKLSPAGRRDDDEVEPSLRGIDE